MMGNYGGHYGEMMDNSGGMMDNYGESRGIMEKLLAIMGEVWTIRSDYEELWGIMGNYGGIVENYGEL